MRRLGAVFLGAFAAYAWAAPAWLAPYRDSGEMASSAWTLGVSHPTSYPLYILLGRLAAAVPLGTPAHRVALLSAAFAALAVAAVFELCRARFGLLAGCGAALLLALNPVFCSVVVVQEMYTLWVLLGALCLVFALRLNDGFDERLWLAFCLFFALALGNRLDLLLWAPGLLWLSLPGGKKVSPGAWAGCAFLIFPALMAFTGRNWPVVILIGGTALWLAERKTSLFQAAVFFTVGFSIYLYLPLRSAQHPWLDWNHPAVLANFAESLLRSKYGGTLDLLSKSYALGENFAANLRLYGRHLWAAFWAVGLAAAVVGAGAQARRAPRLALGLAALWFWSGPFFLFIANMPPNPHAAAIVEPHYLLSDLVLVLWAAEGLALAASRPLLEAAAVAALAVAPFAHGLRDRLDRRWHLYDYDYARAVLRSAPPRSTIVLKKDVPLYTLWYAQTVAGLRSDVRVLAQGLAGSPWYQDGWRRRDPDALVVELRDEQGWRGAASADAPLFAATDAEPPPSVAQSLKARGLLAGLDPAAPAENAALWALTPLRGDYDYEAAPDFFTSDLIDAYAVSLFRLGGERAQAGDRAEAERLMRRAWSMHWLFPDVPAYLGFLALRAGDPARARQYYALASALAERMIALADAYNALPAVREAVRRGAAEDLMHLGVTFDKLGERDAARGCYERSIATFPLAEAHYDYAVLYWGRDRAVVERELEAALKLNPGHADAARYLRYLRGNSLKRN